LRELRINTTTVGYLLAAIGIFGVLMSLAGETSDYVDPLTFTFATVSIFVAIVGIALAFRMPGDDKTAKRGV
jgi:cyanate permease